MTTFIKSKLDDIELVIETAPATGGLESAPRLGVDESELTPERVTQLEQAIQVAGRIADKMKQEVVEPQGANLSRVGIKLNLGFTAEGSLALFARATGSASLEVSIEWAR